jgi:hypothetical protein
MAAVGHGDHWLAALAQDDPRLADALAVPVDAPAGLRLHRSPLNEALDRVQVTRDRRLVTAYPEPRATALVRGLRPRELHLWETRAEGWLTVEHETVGALTLFLTDLAEHAPKYAAAGTRRGLDLEVGGVAYAVARGSAGKPPRLQPAARVDARFLPDDYAFDAEVLDAEPAGDGEVLDLLVQGGLSLPVAWRERSGLSAGEHAQGFLWLTGRLPDEGRR